MADRTTNTLYESKAIDRLSVPIANGVAIPVGSLVQEEGGYANHFNGDNTFLGIVVGGENLSSTQVPTGDTSASPVPTVYVDTSGATITGIPVAGASAQTTVGEFVYCIDSDLAGASLTQVSTDSPIGILVGWRSATDADVRLFSAIEHLLGTTAADTPGTDWV